MYGLTGEKANSNMLTIHDIISGKKSDDGLGVTSVYEQVLENFESIFE